MGARLVMKLQSKRPLIPFARSPLGIMGAKHDPPQHYLVPVQMEQLMARHEEMVNTMHQVERVALFHYIVCGRRPLMKN